MTIFDKIVESFEQRLASAQEKNITKSKILYWQLMKAYFERAAKARAENRPLIWMGGFFPLEILFAMDTVPFFPDQFAIQMVATGEGSEFFGIGEGYGFCKDSCATHIATVGLVNSGLLPPPDIIMGSSACDSYGGLMKVLCDIKKVPSFFTSFPYRRDQEAIGYIKRQLVRGIEFLEDVTGKKLDQERMVEYINNSNLALEHTFKVNELRKNIPAPISGREAYSAFAARMCADGLPECLEFFRTHYRELQTKVQLKEGVVPEERHRLFLYGAMPFWHMRFLDWIEQTYKAVIVADMFSCTKPMDFGDTSDPLDCMARKMFMAGPGIKMFNGPIKECIQEIVEALEEYKVDSAIYFASFGCKQTCGFVSIVVDEIREKRGLSTLVLDIDSGRPEIVPLSQMEANVHQYFAMLERR